MKLADEQARILAVCAFCQAPREWGEGADTVSAPRARGGVGA